VSLLAFLAAAAGHLALVNQIQTIAQENDVPAAALVIIDPSRGNIVEAWGRTGNPAYPKADPDTPFRLGSISKTFTALTMLRLVDAGKVRLETPVRDIIDGATLPYASPWAATRPLRVVHLLELTAGLPDLSRQEWENNDPSPLSLHEALALNPANREVLWPPGVQHSYSNSPPGLSALVIERLTGRSFEAVARDEVLNSYGMSQASYLRTDALAKRLPRGYRADGVTEIPYWHMTFRAFGGLNASSREMAAFLAAMLADPALNRRARPRSTLAARAGLRIGYGLGIYGSVREGHVFLGHGGDADGFRSRYGLLPAAKRGYFVAINADAPRVLARMRRAIELHLTSDLDRPDPPARPNHGADLSSFAGTYYPTSARFRVDTWQQGQLPEAVVRIAGKHLLFSRRDKTTRLIPLGDGLFRRPDDPEATVAFIRQGETLFLQGEVGNYARMGGLCKRAFIARCLWQ
jgi:CubicO group peptidase (beta-lactamase class C family)